MIISPLIAIQRHESAAFKAIVSLAAGANHLINDAAETRVMFRKDSAAYN
jgi:hypothetical protein